MSVSIQTSGEAAMPRIQGRECSSYPASEQVPTWLAIFLHFMFSYSETIFALRKLMPHHEFVLSLSYFLVSKLFILKKEIKAKPTFNTSLHGKLFCDLIVPKNFGFTWFFINTLLAVLIWAI